jgi:hypothetical protein
VLEQGREFQEKFSSEDKCLPDIPELSESLEQESLEKEQPLNPGNHLEIEVLHFKSESSSEEE